MTKRSARAAGAAACVAWASGAVAAEEPRPAAAGFRVEETAQWTRLAADLPGSLAGFALPANADGSRSIVLLVGPPESQATDPGSGAEDAPKPLPACPPLSVADRPRLSVYRWDPGQRESLRLLRDDVPGDASGVTVLDLDADRNEEVIVVRPAELLLVTPDATRVLIEAPGLLPGPPPLTWLSLGRLRVLGPRPDGSGLAARAEIELPRRAHFAGNEWIVDTRAPVFTGRRADGTLVYVTPAQPHGKQRLQSLLIELPPNGAARVVDCWMRLPGSEDLLEQRFLFADGRPLLFVSTKPAGSLSFFGEKQLRLFPLESDRSRLGRPPSFVAGSRMNLWQPGEPLLADADGDGREDLLVGYWKGLKDARVVLDVYRRREDGSLATSPEITSFEVRDGDRSFLSFGQDLDGDGRSDLVLRDGERLLVYRGRPSRRGASLVEETAVKIPWPKDGPGGETYIGISTQGFSTWTAGVPDGRPQIADLDGDGRSEVLALHRGTAEHAPAFHVLWIKGAR